MVEHELPKLGVAGSNPVARSIFYFTLCFSLPVIMGFSFRIDYKSKDTNARVGRVTTPHGQFITPVFMPVGTQGTVKTQTPRDLKSAGVEIIVSNTYHLFLRPGHNLIRELGGLHKFMGWDRPILTDSGGFQVFSLADLRKVTDEGTLFHSHIDGAKHFFTPEVVMDVEIALGGDIIMVFDVCLPYPADKGVARIGVERTIRWARRCVDHFQKYGDTAKQVLFGIVQGSVYEDLREMCATALIEMDFFGYAIGGVAVGESKEEIERITRFTADLLPEDKPRYLMGVGHPDDIVRAVRCGVDMFDCVIPTRNGRTGTVFTMQGKMVVKNAVYADDERPIEEGCGCYACKHFTRAYIRHLFQVGEILAPYLATLHNIHFFMRLMSQIRTAIAEGLFSDWAEEFLANYKTSQEVNN